MSKNPVTNMVSNPPHYGGSIECKDALKAMLETSKLEGYQDYWRGCALKYLWRCDRKGKTIEDLQKARQCIEFLIDDIEATQAPKGVLTER